MVYVNVNFPIGKIIKKKEWKEEVKSYLHEKKMV